MKFKKLLRIFLMIIGMVLILAVLNEATTNLLNEKIAEIVFEILPASLFYMMTMFWLSIYLDQDNLNN